MVPLVDGPVLQRVYIDKSGHFVVEGDGVTEFSAQVSRGSLSFRSLGGR